MGGHRAGGRRGGQSPRTHAQGDADLSNDVGLNDLLILSNTYGLSDDPSVPAQVTTLTAGTHLIRVEYKDLARMASLGLKWIEPGQTEPVDIPESQLAAPTPPDLVKFALATGSTATVTTGDRTTLDISYQAGTLPPEPITEWVVDWDGYEERYAVNSSIIGYYWPTAGSKDVRAWAKGASGTMYKATLTGTSTDTLVVTVAADNVPDIRVGAVPGHATAGLPFGIYVTRTNALVDGLKINWGDSPTPQSAAVDLASYTHTYAAPGHYTVTVTPQIGGVDQTPTHLSFAAAANGSLAPVTGQFTAGEWDEVAAAARDAAGGLIVGGSDGQGRFGLLRYKPGDAGELDETFGNASPTNGHTILDLGTVGTQHRAGRTAAMAIDGDGRIYLAGDVYTPAGGYQFVLARFLSDGTVDTSFGDLQSGSTTVHTGFVTTDFGVVDDNHLDARANALAVDPLTGQITLAGFAGSALALARYDEDGAPVTTFGDSVAGGGQSGRIRIELGQYADIAYGVKFDSAGKMVVTGRAGGDMAVLRFTAGGALDTAFDSDGIKVFDVGVGDFAYDVDFAADGSMVVAGEANAHMTLMRLDSAGDSSPRSMAPANWSTPGSMGRTPGACRWAPTARSWPAATRPSPGTRRPPATTRRSATTAWCSGAANPA